MSTKLNFERRSVLLHLTVENQIHAHIIKFSDIIALIVKLHKITDMSVCSTGEKEIINIQNMSQIHLKLLFHHCM